jgi:hypothetical protein
MFGLCQTVSLLLLGFGALLGVLGTMSLFFEPPEGVALEAARNVTTIFTIGGVLGLGLIAWGIYLRVSKPGAENWPLWVTYVVLLGPLVGLAVFVGDEIVEMVGASSSRSGIRGTVKGIIGVRGYGSSDLRQGRAPLPGIGVVEYGSGWENNPAPRIGVSSWSNCGGTLGSDATSSAGGSRFRGRHKGDRLRFAALPKLAGQF